MDTLEFFQTVLPAAGHYCSATPFDSGRGFRHSWQGTLERLVEVSMLCDEKYERNVYFALASFKEPTKREQANVAYLRSFWADIDCGPGKPYATAKEGASAVLLFSQTAGLPRPFLVASGNGVHAYWPMDGDMVPAVWRPTAELLKAALEAEGVAQDKSRTADHASVLRPPGTHHRKSAPRLVRVVVRGDVGRLADFQAALLPYAKFLPMSQAVGDNLVPEGGPAEGFQGSNADLTNGQQTREADAHLMAAKCGVLGLVRDTAGAVDQPTWYRAIGTLSYTKQGNEIAHEWSKGDSRYSHDEVERKIKQYRSTSKPATCARLGEDHPEICGACPHKGSINSPWVLGLVDEGTTVDVVEKQVKTATGWKTVAVAREFPFGFRSSWVNDKDVLQFRSVEEGENGSDVIIWDTFCETVVVPITRLWIEGVAYVECEMNVRGGGKRNFLLEGGVIGKGKDTLAAELGRNEVVCSPGKGQIMDSYLKSWMQRLKDEADQVVAYRQFGWHSDRFVLGDVVIAPATPPTRAVVVGMAKSKHPYVAAKGSLERWVEIIDTAYNAPGQEGYQFLVTCGFAAPLISMMQQVNGVTVYAHSEGSGVGKTTAQRAALSAWGNWEELMLADQKTTQNALWGLMGAYNSLPIVYDELTNMPNNLASELVFSVSSGRAKQRMTSGGELRENNANWCTILMASGNNLLSEKLSLHRGNAEAEISRLFEFTLEATPHLTPNQANTLFPDLLNNYGHAGRAYAEFLVNNYDTVSSMLKAAQEKINSAAGITQVERYWSALFAAVLTAGAICRQLGLLRFDFTALRHWMFARLAENRIHRNEAATPALQLFGEMLADLWQGVLVTQGEGDVRKGVTAQAVQTPRGPLVGRAIIPANRFEQSVLLLNSRAVKDWSNKRGVSAREMFGAAVREGWADANEVRYSLGKGTAEYSRVSSAVACWKLNPERFGAAAGTMVAQKLGVVDAQSAAGV